MKNGLMWESLTPQAFNAWVEKQGKPIGSPESPAFRWFVCDLAREVVKIEDGWIHAKGVLVRVPKWAEKLPARIGK